MRKKGREAVLFILLFLSVFFIGFGLWLDWQTEHINQEQLRMVKEVIERNKGHPEGGGKIDKNKQETGGGTLSEEASNYLGYLNIPKIGAEYAIVEGVSATDISRAVGHIPSSAPLNADRGNTVLCGHRGGKHGKFFKHLNRLSVGDEVFVTDITGRCAAYAVTDSYVASPTEPKVQKQGEERVLTLVTCTVGGKNRLVVICRPKIESGRGESELGENVF